MGWIIPYIMKNKIHVPNHHPAIASFVVAGTWNHHCFPIEKKGQPSTIMAIDNNGI
jgi:hypothetical protein